MLADWQAIASPGEAGARNVRLADSTHPLDFRIGRDFRGRYLFQLDSAYVPTPASALPRLSGMDCEWDELGNDRVRLCLVLHHKENLSNFSLMCTGLMLATESITATQSARGMLRTIEELHRWQEMLRRRRDTLLSRNEQIGLLGELLFFRDELEPRWGVLPALHSWNGPEGHEQDFVVGGTIFEVKTQVVTADRRIRISSEDQLDPVQGRILICNQGVAPLPIADSSARTLNSLVAEIGMQVASAGSHAGELFEIAMLRAGYEPRDEYDEESWVLIDRAFYEVSGDFPRIERADLRKGVEMVKYSIRVSDCQTYVVDIEKTMTELCNEPSSERL